MILCYLTTNYKALTIVQYVPFPLNGKEQLQVNEPIVFVQTALDESSQLLVPSVHSSTSSQLKISQEIIIM